MKERNVVAITDNIISLKAILFRAIGRPVFKNPTITPGAFYAILCLKRFGPLSMSEIGKHLHIPKPNVTLLVDQLIDKKLAERLPDKNDRRIIKIKLTPKGLQFIEKNKKIFRDQIKMKLTTLTDKELNVFSESLQNVRDTLVKISQNDEN
jgi:DNA-binding MarR family transcriptional regulator